MSAAPLVMMGNLAPSERAFAAAVVEYARLCGWIVGRSWSSLHSPYGEPDLRLLRPPRLMWAELKTDSPRSQPTGEQYEWLAEGARVPGVETYLFRPSDWPEIEEVLR